MSLILLALSGRVGIISTLAEYLLRASLISLLLAALFWRVSPFLLSYRTGEGAGGADGRSVSRRVLLILAALFFGLSSLFAELDVRPVLRGSSFTATAELGRETAQQGIDGDMKTGWSSVLPRRKGNYYQVDFHRVIPLRKITFLYGGSPWDFPWEYRIYALTGPGQWEEVAVGSKDISPVEVKIKPVKARIFRIVGADEDPSNIWRIDEVRVYANFPYGAISSGFMSVALLVILALLSLIVAKGDDERIDARVAALLLVIALAGFTLRSYHLLDRGMGLDEKGYLALGEIPLDKPGAPLEGSDMDWLGRRWNTNHDLVPILRTLIPRIIYRAVPSPVLAVRLSSVVLGTLTIFLVFSLWKDLSGRRPNPYEALLAAALLTVETLHLSLSRRGYSHLPMSFFFVLYLYVFYRAWTGSRGRYFYWAGTPILFLGYLFHPLMLLAPASVLIYLAGSALWDLMTKGGKLLNIIQGWVPYLVSLLPFALYVIYTLAIRGGTAGIEAGETNIELAGQSSAFAALLQFVEGRGYVVHLNYQQLFLQGGLLQYFSLPELAAAGLGGASVLIRRDRGEVFLLSQMVVFSSIVFLIWHSSLFLKHYPPAVVIMSCMTARGAVLVSERISALSQRHRTLLAAIPITSLLLIMVFLSFNMVFRGLGQ